MAQGVLTPTQPATPPSAEPIGGGGNGDRFSGPGGRGDDGRWEPSASSLPARTYRTGMWMGLAAIVMMFAAFTSALVVRKGLSTDWVRTGLPRVLYLNTLVLLASSATLEVSRRSLRKGLVAGFVRWWSVTTLLGLAFLSGQLLAWKELEAGGVYLATNPSSSFFYLLTAAHGAHLAGGVIALLYIALRAKTLLRAARGRAAVDAAATYWHFMDGLWVYILLLLMTRS